MEKTMLHHLFEKRCKECKKIYFIHFCRINISKFCSYKCKGKSITGSKLNNNHKIKIGLSLKGRKLSQEHRKKISKAHLGKLLPQLSGRNNSNWRGGVHKHSKGYILIYSLNHPYAYKRYILKHRLVMEKHLGRYLKSKEVVHHINGKVDDNRIKNLMLFKNNIEHMKYHKNVRKSKLTA